MSKTKNKTCIYCGLRTEMPVVETGCVSDGKPIKMYKLQCPRCGRGQWTHDNGGKRMSSIARKGSVNNERD